MKVIPREAKRITYSTEIRELKKKLHLTDVQRAVVVGSILGDGHLELNWSKTNARLRIAHSKKQEEYVEWKYILLRDWILMELYWYPRNYSLSFSTISHPELTDLWKLFYRSRKKIIPSEYRSIPR